MALTFKEMSAGIVSDNVDFAPMPVSICYIGALVLLIGTVFSLFGKAEPLREGNTIRQLPLALALIFAIFPIGYATRSDVATFIGLISAFTGFILLSRFFSRCGATLSDRHPAKPQLLLRPLPGLAATAALAVLTYVYSIAAR